MSFGVIDRAGVYRLADAGEGTVADSTVAVNLLDPTESGLAVRDSLRVAGEVAGGKGAGTGPREIWPWLVLAALVLLSVEWVINAWLMRA